MGATGFEPPPDRARVGWWLFVLGLGVVAGFVAYSFVGMLVLGVFGYYATRPICRRLRDVVDSEEVAAWATVVLILLPLVFALFYAGFQLFEQAEGILDGAAGSLPFDSVLEMLPSEQREPLTTAFQNPNEFVSDPQQSFLTVFGAVLAAASAVFGGLLLVGLSATLAFFLLANEIELSAGFRQLVGGRDTTAYAYAAAVDEDLESVFFGNFLFIVAMTALATVTYWATNALAPAELEVPMVLVLGFLTGIASLIPIVVGKVVYLPVVAYLAVQAFSLEGTQFLFVGGVLVVYFLILDVLPQTFLQPYITGRQIEPVLLLFAYLLGPVLFGWYGFFLLPILFILILEVVRIVLPQLVHGEAVTPAVEMGESVGTTPREERDNVPDEEITDGEPAGDGS